MQQRIGDKTTKEKIKARFKSITMRDATEVLIDTIGRANGIPNAPIISESLFHSIKEKTDTISFEMLRRYRKTDISETTN
jgi:hypothetical protein